MKKSNEIKRIKEIPSAYTHPTNHSPSIITQDSSNRFVTDTEKSTWNDKVTQTDINNSINAIEIGGRNLLLNSEIEYTVANSSMINENHIPNQYSVTLTPSTQYTLSFDLYADNKVLSVDSHFVANFGEYKSKSYTNTNGIYARRIFTFTTGSNANGSGYIRFDNNGSTDGSLATLKVRRVKLEKGNKATDWTPAIEDVQEQIDTKATQTDINNSINSIEVGGRNLIILSKLGSNVYINTTPTITNGVISTVGINNILTINRVGWIPENREYTLSGIMKKNGVPVTNAMWKQRCASINSTSTQYFYVDDTTGKFVITETYNGSSSLILHLYITFNVGDVITLEKFKMEKGNKATDWTPAPEDVQEQIDTKATQATINTSINAIQIGGRNFLQQSDFENGVGGFSVYGGAFGELTNSADYSYNNTKSLKLAVTVEVGKLTGVTKQVLPMTNFKGKIVTLSWKVKGVGSSIGKSVYANIYDNVTFSTNGAPIVLTDSWQHIQVTKTISNTATVMQVYWHGQLIAGDIVYADCAKLEMGNKATDWTPAIEDVQEQIDTRATQTDINNSIDAIQIGGRNLLSGTKDMDGMPYKIAETFNGFAVTTVTPPAFPGYFADAYSKKTPILDGLEYTVSFYAKSTLESQDVQCFFHNPGTTVSGKSSTGQISTDAGGATQVSVTNTWKRYWVTWKQSIGGSSKSLIVGRAHHPGGSVSISAVKIEKGNKATDWSPAPEDKADKITNGTTATRPTPTYIGQSHFDTTLGKPIWCKTVDTPVWIDSTGTTV